MQLRSRSSGKALSYAATCVLVAALIVPLAGTAAANHPASCLDVTPETAAVAVNTSHVLTATLRDPSGTCSGATVTANNGSVDIDFELAGPNDQDDGNFPNTPDLTCSIPQGSSSCTTNYTGTLLGTDTVRAWIDHDKLSPPNGVTELDTGEARDDTDTDTTDVVDVTWQSAATANRLDCTPETDTNPTNTAHVITCTARNASNALVNNVRVDVEATGINDPDGNTALTSPDFSCTTAADGTCTVTHPANQSAAGGTTAYRAWIDADNSNTTVEADQTEGRDAATTPGTKGEEDDTDVVEKTWDPNLVATRLDCAPETDTNDAGTSHTFTCTARNNSDATVANIPIDVEANGANDPDNQTSRTSPDFSCTTGSNGSCSIVHGPGGTGTTTGAGTTTYRAWIDADNSNSTDESDDSEGRDAAVTDGDTAEPDNTDVVEKTWVSTAVPTRLDCTPETDSNSTGTAHVVTCTATNNQGATQSGARVDVEATGTNDPDNANSANSPDFTCTTGSNGSCSITHGPGGTGTTNTAGTTTYRAWIDIDNNNTTSEADATEGRDEVATVGATTEPDDTDVVAKTWVVVDARTIDCEPETDSNPLGSSHTVTCTVRDQLGGVRAGEGVTFTETGPGSFTGLITPTTNAQGQVTVTVTSATEVGDQSITGTLTDDLAGNEPSEVDDCDRAAGDPAGAPAGVCSDTVTKTWTAGEPASIEISPSEVTNQPGESQVVTATVRDAQGNLVVGADVFWSVEGVGAIAVVSSETGPSGTVDATVTSAVRGNTFITATTSPCAAGGDCEDDAVAHWGPASCDIFGTPGNDVLEGGSGGETICGFGGNDFLSGGGGNDILRGGGGRDVLQGGDGNDVLKGGKGSDILKGGRGDDILKGGKGDDSLNGQGGRDDCRGGAGRDTLRSC